MQGNSKAKNPSPANGALSPSPLVYNPPYSPRVTVKVLTGKRRLPRYEFNTPTQVYQYNPMPTSTQLASRPRLQIIRGLPASRPSFDPVAI